MRAARLARRLLGAAAAALFLWGAAVAVFHASRHALIYPFQRLPPPLAGPATLPGVAHTLRAADGTALALRVLPGRPEAPLVLHFPGNAASLGGAVRRLAPFAAEGWGIAVAAYRGSEGRAGAPTQAALVADALAVLDALGPLAGLPEGHAPVLWGTSLGAAVAVQVAARRPVAGLVLEAPFARLCEVAEHLHPWLPACLVLSDERWDSLAAAGRVAAPALVLHGGRDRVIPPAQGAALAEALGARFVLFRQAGHDDLLSHGAAAEIRAFVAALGAPVR